MLNGIKNLLKTHNETVVSANRLFEKTESEIKGTYNRELSTDKLGKAKNILDQTIAESQDATFRGCREILDDVMAKAREEVKKPVEGDFTATLEAIKLMENPSKTELDEIAKKYKKNYFCYRAICDALGGALAGYKVVTIDDISDLVSDLKASLKHAIYGDVTSYSYRLMLHGAFIDSYDKIFVDFLNGDFEQVAETVNEDNENITE